MVGVVEMFLVVQEVEYRVMVMVARVVVLLIVDLAVVEDQDVMFMILLLLHGLLLPEAVVEEEVDRGMFPEIMEEMPEIGML